MAADVSDPTPLKDGPGENYPDAGRSKEQLLLGCYKGGRVMNADGSGQDVKGVPASIVILLAAVPLASAGLRPG